MKNIIITINGVLNSAPSLLDGVKILPDKVLLLNKFITKNRYSLYIYNSDDRLNKKDFEFICNMLSHLGLSHKAQIFHTSSELANFIKSNDYVILTSEQILRNLNKRVIFTNIEQGLQESDLHKSFKL